MPVYEFSTFCTRSTGFSLRALLQGCTWVPSHESPCKLVSVFQRYHSLTSVQKIMLHLQQKAHYSLEEYRRGNTSTSNRYPPGSEPVSPDNDNDELAILGGKTRLVAKIEPSSPQILERSPNSQNPIVPLPLSPTMQNHLDPSVVEYLQSFGPPSTANGPTSPGNQGPSPQRGSFTDVDLSPVSAYGMTTINAPGYQQDTSSFMAQSQQQIQAQQQQGIRHAGPGHHPNGNTVRDVTMAGPTSGGANGSSAASASFPQYFPVFDYGNGMVDGSRAYPTAPILETPSPTGPQRKSSGSPEGNMHSTWQDFVIGLQMS